MRLRLGRLVLAPVLALAPMLMHVAPVAANPTGSGNGLQCSASDPTTITQYSSPQQVSLGGGAGVNCPQPGDSGSPFSKGGQPAVTGPPPQPPPKGAACNLQLQEWVEFQLAGSTPEFRIWGPANPASGQTVTIDASNPGFTPSAWSSSFNAYGVTVDLYNQAGKQDIYIPMSFVGKYTGNGWQCSATQGPGTGFITQCNTNALCFNGNPTGPTTSPGLPIAALPINLNAFVQGQFTGGNITSLPAQPNNPTLVNLDTCFYISNMTVAGGGNPLLPRDWEQIVEDPNVDGPFNRHVYFTLIYHVYLIETDFDFGDGTTVAVDPTAGSAGNIPLSCGNIANQQYLVTHKYTSYTSAGNPFQVKVTHKFGADVTELWNDSNGTNVRQFGQVVTVPVLTNPFPYNVNVVQEEGVPVG